MRKKIGRESNVGVSLEEQMSEQQLEEKRPGLCEFLDDADRIIESCEEDTNVEEDMKELDDLSMNSIFEHDGWEGPEEDENLQEQDEAVVKEEGMEESEAVAEEENEDAAEEESKGESSSSCSKSEKKAAKKRAWKKPAGKPRRGLTSYNLFFMMERERLLHGNADQPATVEEVSRMAKLRKPSKRVHCKSHGKISFTELARVIAERWKRLDSTQLAIYNQVAQEEKQRYERELNEWKAAKVEGKEPHIITPTTPLMQQSLELMVPSTGILAMPKTKSDPGLVARTGIPQAALLSPRTSSGTTLKEECNKELLEAQKTALLRDELARLKSLCTSQALYLHMFQTECYPGTTNPSMVGTNHATGNQLQRQATMPAYLPSTSVMIQDASLHATGMSSGGGPYASWMIGGQNTPVYQTNCASSSQPEANFYQASAAASSQLYGSVTLANKEEDCTEDHGLDPLSRTM